MESKSVIRPNWHRSKKMTGVVGSRSYIADYVIMLHIHLPVYAHVSPHRPTGRRPPSNRPCLRPQLVWPVARLVGRWNFQCYRRVRIRVKVRVSVMVRVSVRTSCVVNFTLFRCYQGTSVDYWPITAK